MFEVHRVTTGNTSRMVNDTTSRQTSTLGKLLATRVVIAIAIVTMMALSFISFSRIQRLNELSEWVNHTHRVQLELQRTYARLRDADGSLHAFILTNDSSHYQDLMDHETLVRESVSALLQLTSDNQSQNRGIDVLDSLIKARYVFMEKSMAASRANYQDYTEHILALNNEIKMGIEVLNAEEDNLLSQREISATEYKSGTPVFLFTIEVAIITFLFVAYSRVSKDLKVRAELQKGLEQQRDFIKTILDNSIDIIRVVDKDFRLLAFNKKAAEQYHVTDDMIGKNILDLFPISGTPAHLALMAAMKGEPIHVKELTPPALPGRIFESFFIPLKDERGIYAVLAMQHEITDIVTASLSLETMNKELKRSNDDLEQFAHVTSHDLQEPVRRILTYVSLTLNTKDENRIKELLSKIESSAQRMYRLIHDILDYSKAKASDTPKVAVDLNVVLEQAKDHLELQIQEKNVSVVSGVLPTILGSGQQLIQVFFNVIGNSIKFCEGTPKIEIHCQAVDPNLYKIEFVDNGIGFESERAREIFEPFKRLNNKNSYAGSGIGLALCKRIVENHRGSIAASSAPGKGTTITLHLPTMESALQANLHQVTDRTTTL